MSRARRTILMCLIQCGETDWQRERRVQGAADLPISASGRAAATASAARMDGASIGAVYHPPDEAATDTARIYAGALDVRARPVEDLVDPGLGLLEGLREQVIAERYPKRYKQWQEDPLSLSPPEGEDLIEARARVFDAVARLLRRSRAPEVGIVLHDLSLGFLRCWLAERPARDFRSMLKDRPRVERYVLTGEVLQQLADVAAETASRS